MESKIAKRDRHGLWRWTCLKSQSSFKAAEAIERLHGGRVTSREEENGVVRVKIVVSKQELRQMVAWTSQKRSNASHPSMAAPPNFEQLLHVLRKRHMKRAEAGKEPRGEWRPALQSIPEEN